MRASRLVRASTTAILLIAAPASAQQQIPLRTLTPAVASDSGVLRNIVGVHQLPDGRVLVNDPARRRLLMFAPTLAAFTVVLDTSGGAANKYGGQVGGLIPYLGDSTLFVDYDAKAFVVIDPTGKVVRTMAPPKATDLIYIVRPVYGTPRIDVNGRLIYCTRRLEPPNTPSFPLDSTGKPTVTSLPDSAPILRADFDARAVDTIAFIRIPVQKSVMTRLANGITYGFAAFNPVPSTDEWAMLPDGTIAMVRGYDYHIDWLSPNGKQTSSPKMPFDWRRITLEEKVQMIDSIRDADAERKSHEPPKPPPPPMAPGRSASLSDVVIPFVTVEPTDLPDYYPPVRQGQVKADPDGNVWILPATSTLAGRGLVWDVVNRKGEVFERVQLPEGRNIAGFGPGGVVYMSHSPNPGDTRLERARIAK